MKKRIVSLLMAVLMTVSLLPTAAWAEVLEAEASQEPAAEEMVEPETEAPEETEAAPEETVPVEEETASDAQPYAMTDAPAVYSTTSSGQCGDNLTWTLDDAGTLTISGTGAMWNRWDESYESELLPEWYNCTIMKIVIDNGVTIIGDGAFQNCSGLTEAVIASTVTEIGGDAFANCKALEEVTISGANTFAISNAFYGCDSLSTISYGGTMAQWKDGAGAVVALPLRASVICTNGTIKPTLNGSCGASARYSISSAGVLTISGTGAMADYTYDVYTDSSDCPWHSVRYAIKEIVIEDGITHIGNCAFMYDTDVASVTIPNSVTSVGDWAFCGCFSLTEITLPEGVESIGAAAFGSCSALTAITIPGGVTSVGEGAFYDCSNLTTVNYGGTEAQWNAIGGGNAGVPESTTITYSALDTALKNAGFTAPEPGKDFGVDVPCWGEYNDLCRLSFTGSAGEMTLNLNAASAEAWNAAYEQSVKDFGNETSDVVMCAIDYFAPTAAVQYASYIGRSADAARAFAENEGTLTSLGSGDNCATGTTPIAMVDTGRGYITNMWDYTIYYLVAFYDAAGEAVAKYALKIHVESEPFLHSTTGTSTTEALRSAGYTIPAENQLYVDMPEGLEKGTDYTINYDQITGHMTVKILPGDKAHWQQAFEMLLERYDFEEACNWFAAIMGFEQVANANNLICYFAGRDDAAVGSFISDTYTDSFGWDTGEELRPGSGYTLADISRDGNSSITISVPQGSGWVRCIAVWADSSGNVLNKFMYTLSIEVDNGFEVQWDNTPLEEQLRDEDFIYPTMGDMETNRQYGYFYLDVPKGLVENTDYTYTYDQTTGTLTINMLEGEYADWKAAYLNRVISEPEKVYIDFGVHFSPSQAEVDNVANAVGREAIQALLRDEYPDDRFYFEDLDYGYCGSGFTGVWLDSSDSAITIRAKQGAEELIYAVVWADHATGNIVAKYMLKVVINVENGFSHTIKTPQVRDIDASRITVDDKITGGKSAWNIVNKNGQLAFMPASGRTLAGIMNGETYITSFDIKSPGPEYTLQSYYVRQFRDGSNMEEKAPTNLTFTVDAHDNLVGSDTGIKGGTLRYTLRWSSNDPNLPDLVEKLNVRIGDYAVGKTTVTGIDEMDSDPNILDVQNMYEHMTKSQTVSGDGNDTDQVDSDLATYDINFDGSADVYDLQGLYETVANTPRQ